MNSPRATRSTIFFLPSGIPCCSLNAPTLTFPSTQHELEFKPCRYARLRESAQSYMVNQVGVSCFKYVPQGAKGPRGEQGPGYVASTFNFYVFPEPLKDSSQVFYGGGGRCGRCEE